jgi:membrane protein
MKKRFKSLYEWGKTALDIFVKSNCSIYAASLTYYSILSVVPVLCIFLLGAKAVGVHDLAREKIHRQFEMFMEEFEQAPENSITTRVLADESTIVEKVKTARTFAAEARNMEKDLFDALDRIDFETIGWIGFIMLLWSSMCSIGVIERSFNEIWNCRKPRVFWKRYLLYLGVLLMLPLLIGLSVSVPVLELLKNIVVNTAGATDWTRWISDALAWLIDSTVLRKAVTLIFSSLTFAFMFKVLPIGEVRFRHAFWSGLMTSVGFGFWLKICTVAQVGISNSSMLYGSLALLPIILAWIVVSWQIILFGCCSMRAVYISERVRKTDGL